MMHSSVKNLLQGYACYFAGYVHYSSLSLQCLSHNSSPLMSEETSDIVLTARQELETSQYEFLYHELVDTYNMTKTDNVKQIPV